MLMPKNITKADTNTYPKQLQIGWERSAPDLLGLFQVVPSESYPQGCLHFDHPFSNVMSELHVGNGRNLVLWNSWNSQESLHSVFLNVRVHKP